MLKYGKKLRISKSSELSQLFKCGIRAGDHRILLIGLPTQGETRAGVAISVKHGNSVQRNRLKRLLREAFRLERPNLPANFDFVISPRVGTDSGLDGFRKSLVMLASRLAEKTARRATSKKGYAMGGVATPTRGTKHLRSPKGVATGFRCEHGYPAPQGSHATRLSLGAVIRKVAKIPAMILIFLARFYQAVLSPYLGRQCRFVPTCSNYFIQAVMQYGAIKGTLLGLRRICRCHPFSRKSGYDPVP